ncbi:MAG: hypothetical protein Q8Q32_01815 [bacterium]|nr:hypothetical protein [bacterium]
MKYFIASSWSNMKQVQLLTENLTALGHEVFSYVKDKRNFVPGEELIEEDKFKNKDYKTDPEIKEIYEKDIEGLSEADVFIMVLPAGNSSHITAGIAFALNKKTILIGSPEKTETHYLIFNQQYNSIEDCVASIKEEKSAR